MIHFRQIEKMPLDIALPKRCQEPQRIEADQQGYSRVPRETEETMEQLNYPGDSIDNAH